MSDTFQVRLERLDGYRFRTDFESREIPPLFVDEPPPLGAGSGPNPARLLAAAVGNCLSASLIFCLSKNRVEVSGIEATVSGTYRRNERNRLRIGGMEVAIVLEVPGSEPAKLSKCLELFEDFCVVTASVRKGIPVVVTVSDPSGNQLYRRAAD